jgi:hypothetical protein
VCSIRDGGDRVDDDRYIIYGATPYSLYVTKEIQVQYKYYCIKISSVISKLRSVNVLSEIMASDHLLRNIQMIRFQVSAPI